LLVGSHQGMGGSILAEKWLNLGGLDGFSEKNMQEKLYLTDNNNDTPLTKDNLMEEQNVTWKFRFYCVSRLDDYILLDH